MRTMSLVNLGLHSVETSPGIGLLARSFHGFKGGRQCLALDSLCIKASSRID
jgi:hypothetical protein